MSIKILIADDHALLRQGIKRVLNFEDDLEVVGEASEGQEALSRTLVLQPDVLLIDLNMPGLSGIASIKELRERNREILVFIITSHDTSYLDDALEEGIYRYMMKPLNPLQLQVNLDAAIRRIGSLNKKITIETDKGVISFNTEEIILVYTERRKTMVKTTDETYKTTQSFLFWEKTLPVFSFAQSHKGIIINLKYVRRVGDDLIEFTTSDEPAYLSVRNRTLFKKKFLQFMNSMN